MTNGWTCKDCGALNSCANYTCWACQAVTKLDTEELRWRRVSRRWEPRDKLLATSMSGTLYRVLRFVGGKLIYTVLVPGGHTYVVDFWRVPPSVINQATEHFNCGCDYCGRTDRPLCKYVLQTERRMFCSLECSENYHRCV